MKTSDYDGRGYDPPHMTPEDAEQKLQQQSAAYFRRMADAEDQCESIAAVGALVDSDRAELERLREFIDKCEAFLDCEGMASTPDEIGEVIERFAKEARG